MGRWTQYDEDEYRLPEGMTRVAYDADTSTYTFKDAQGQLWEGAQGAEFSEMTRIGGTTSSSVDEDVEAAARSDGYQLLATDAGLNPHIPGGRSPYRTLFPFLLVICVFLLLVWRLILPAVSETPNGSHPCAQGTKPYWVQTWDTCWDIARLHGVTLERLKEANGGAALNCDALQLGQRLCLPTPVTEGGAAR